MGKRGLAEHFPDYCAKVCKDQWLAPCSAICKDDIKARLLKRKYRFEKM
jgi:hypothetical protein